jgi:hypothetical protein
MSKLFRNKTFILGFLVGISTVLILNVYTIFKMKRFNSASECVGFPMSFYEKFLTKCEVIVGDGAAVSCYIWHFSWSGAFVDVLTAIIFGLVVGLVYKFDRERFPMGI